MLSFGQTYRDVFVERRALSVTGEYRLDPNTTLGVGLGAGLGGELIIANTRYTITPGWLLTASYSRRLLDGAGKLPFVFVSVIVGGSGVFTNQSLPLPATPKDAVAMYAIDARAALVVGKTLWDVLSPYVALKAFGGPIFWKNKQDEGITGTDQYHYQLAAGAVVALPGSFDVFVEGAPLGERAFSFGAGRAF